MYLRMKSMARSMYTLKMYSLAMYLFSRSSCCQGNFESKPARRPGPLVRLAILICRTCKSLRGQLQTTHRYSEFGPARHRIDRSGEKFKVSCTDQTSIPAASSMGEVLSLLVRSTNFESHLVASLPGK